MRPHRSTTSRVPFVLLVVALLVSASIANGQTLRPHQTTSPSPIADTAARLAARDAAAQTKTRMAPRYKWTAIGLLAGGGMIAFTGAMFGEELCLSDFDEDYCDTFTAAWIGTGVAIAGAGLVVALIGHGKREPVTSDVVIGRNRAAWRVRF